MVRDSLVHIHLHTFLHFFYTPFGHFCNNYNLGVVHRNNNPSLLVSIFCVAPKVMMPMINMIGVVVEYMLSILNYIRTHVPVITNRPRFYKAVHNFRRFLEQITLSAGSYKFVPTGHSFTVKSFIFTLLVTLLC